MKYWFCVICLFCIQFLYAQDIDIIKKQITAIQSQPDKYYFGYAEGLSSGVYLYKLSVEGEKDLIRKCLLLK